MAGPWKALLGQELAPQRTWREVLGDGFDAASRFLAPTGESAGFVACPRTREGGCGWRVRERPDGSLYGFCADGDCGRIDLSRADVAMMRVDWPALLSALARALGLTGSPERVGWRPASACIGWVAPAQTARYPVYFCAATDAHPLLPSLQRFAERSGGGPFALAVPSREALDADSLGLLTRRRACIVVMDEDVSVGAAGRLLADAAADRLTAFALAAAGVGAKPRMPKFPTPEGARWGDFMIRDIDEHTIEVRASVRRGGQSSEATERYSFADLGMAVRSDKAVKPSTDWGRFLINIVQHRRVAAESPKKWGPLRKSKEHVAEMLEDLTGIDGDGAFISHPGRRCYEAVFKVACSPADETPIPDAPRRLNQKGEVARGRWDE